MWPEAGELTELAGPYSWGTEPPPDRPFVRANMICTLDGALAFEGRSGPIGGPADRALFFALRALADVVLVGAGTARTENYGPVVLSPEAQQARAERGQAPLPLLAVVTRSGALDWQGRLFSGTGQRPVVIGPGGPWDDDAAAVAEVITAPGPAGTVDLTAALGVLAARGARHVLCEGGANLNLSLVASGLMDDLCLTLSPKLAGHTGGTLVGGWLNSGAAWAAAPTYPPLRHVAELQLVHVLEEDGFLFLRHSTRRL